MKILLYKKIASFLYPITIKKIVTKQHASLKLQLYCNQLMLSTPDAIYSYGTRYSPFRKTFELLKADLQQVQQVLVLGTGLGSALKILQEKYGKYPEAILVDIDPDILTLSKEWMQLDSKKNVTWICDEARNYIMNSQQPVDLICIDVFNGTFMPYYLKEVNFYIACRKNLRPKGICIFNIIPLNDQEAILIEMMIHETFTHVERIQEARNLFYICSI
ncbi:MAG: hypothetical protein KA198_10455 [Chitinophagaceae bacterium]|nr:hypothetical protein [Chitinophagaceae bacterium]